MQPDSGMSAPARREVALAVPAFVVRQRGLRSGLEQGDARAAQGLRADDRMLVHHGALPGREGAGLLQHAVGHADLAHVVHGCGLAQQQRPICWLAQVHGQGPRQAADAHDVHAGVFVTGLGRARQAQQRVLVGACDFVQRVVALPVHAAEVGHQAFHMSVGVGTEAFAVGVGWQRIEGGEVGGRHGAGGIPCSMGWPAGQGGLAFRARLCCRPGRSVPATAWGRRAW